MDDTEISMHEIFCKLNEISVSLARMEERQKADKISLDKIDSQVNGNGKDGIIDKLVKLEKFETKVVTYAVAGSAVGGVIVNFLLK